MPKFLGLSLNEIEIKNFSISIFENSSKLEEIQISEFRIKTTSSKFTGEGKFLHRAGIVFLNFELGFIPKNFEFEDIEFEASLKLENYSILSFKKYYYYFTLQDFDKIQLSGNFFFKKTKATPEIFIYNSFILYNLNFKKLPASPPLELKSTLSLNVKTWRLVFQNAKVFFKQIAVAEASGFLEIQKTKVKLYLDIHAETCTLERLIDIIISFTEFRMNSNSSIPDFDGKFIIEAKEISFHNYLFQNVKGELNVENTTLNLEVSNANFYNGNISGSGKILVNEKTIFDFSVSCFNIDSESLIGRYTTKKYITGNLSGEFQLRSQGIFYEEFINELHVFGNFQVKNGRLLGYANFFKPILAIGKYLNWNGPKGESTEFEILSGNFNLYKKKIEFSNLSLKGVGIDAKGEGTISLDNSINLKITVSLAGVAGKIISIPILYRGIIPQNYAYIDPFWLGSVYFGFALTGTPYGGMAGSALNEYLEKGVDSIKSFFTDIFSGSKK